MPEASHATVTAQLASATTQHDGSPTVVMRAHLCAVPPSHVCVRQRVWCAWFALGVLCAEMLLWAQAHDPHAVHVRTWLPELACLPACLALEPWRMLVSPSASSGGPPLAPPRPRWACDACTMENESDATVCEVCEAARPDGWGDFRYGDGGDYPLPVVKPKMTLNGYSEAGEAAAQRALGAQPTKPLQVPLHVPRSAHTPAVHRTPTSAEAMAHDGDACAVSGGGQQGESSGGRGRGVRGRPRGRGARGSRVQHGWQ
jgi:hypothetical protein